jgi:hypothetical protein
MKVKKRYRKTVKPKKRRVFAVLPIARYAADIKTGVIWNRMGY